MLKHFKKKVNLKELKNRYRESINHFLQDWWPADYGHLRVLLSDTNGLA